MFPQRSSTCYAKGVRYKGPTPIDDEVLTAAQQRLAELPLDYIPHPAALSGGSRMPLGHNHMFAGRESDLRAIAHQLKGRATVVIGQAAAVTGMGGVGKTQLAAEFVHRYGQYFTGGVFWINFDDSTAIPTEIAECGSSRYMRLDPNFNELPFADQLALVQAEWQNPLPRLLVFDNCEDEALLYQWRPSYGGSRVLVTSRRTQWDVTMGITPLPLNVLSRGESIALLRKYLDQSAIEEDELDAIASEVGDLPLALHLAGSYLRRYATITSPTAYVQQLRTTALVNHPSLEGRQLRKELSPTKHEQHVARTFAISYDQLDITVLVDAVALAMLARAACFAPGEPIAHTLLFATLHFTDDLNATLLAEDALVQLVDLGLLEVGPAGSVLVHRLVAAFTKNIGGDEEAQQDVEITLIDNTKDVIEDRKTWPYLQAHLRTVTDASLHEGNERSGRLCNALGTLLSRINRYQEARVYLERALEYCDRNFGREDDRTAIVLSNLATTCRDQADYVAAQAYH